MNTGAKERIIISAKKPGETPVLNRGLSSPVLQHRTEVRQVAPANATLRGTPSSNVAPPMPMKIDLQQLGAMRQSLKVVNPNNNGMYSHQYGHK